MNKAFIIAILSLACATRAQAQEVYNMVLENATKVVNSPSTNFTQTRIAQFKRTTLLYIKSKAFETMPKVTTQFLDTQAYWLSEFLTLFFDQIVKDKKNRDDQERKARILMFMEASLRNPLFHDKDEETTLSYIKEGSEITPFSLDTNWELAYQYAKEHLK